MEVKTMLPESFEKEEKDERERAALIAPMKTILKILQITKGVVLVLGILLCILLCILFASISDGTISTIISAVITLALVFGGIILLCYIGELRVNAQINHLAVEYQQRNLLKKMVGENKVANEGNDMPLPIE